MITNANSFRNLIDLRNYPIFDWRYYTGWDPVITQQTPFRFIDNAVHNLWRKKAFRDYRFPVTNLNIRSSFYDNPMHDISDEVYERLTPALRLATILLHVTAPLLRSLDPLWIPTPRDYEQLFHDLEAMTGEFRVLYLQTTPLTHPDVTAGMTGVFTDLDVVQNPHLPHPQMPILMALAQELFDELRGDQWLKRFPNRKVKTQTLIAQVFVHEIAHALWFRRRITREQPSSNQEEPTVHPDPYCELGHSVTNFIFGFEISVPYGRQLTRWDISQGITTPQIRPLFDGTDGIMGYDMHGDFTGDTCDSYTIADETLYRFFDKGTWDAVLAGQRLPMYLKPRMIRSATALATLGSLVQRVPNSDLYTSYNPNIIAAEFNLGRTFRRSHPVRPPIIAQAGPVPLPNTGDGSDGQVQDAPLASANNADVGAGAGGDS